MKKVKSIGLIETLGMVGVVEAADAALKAANVTLLGYEFNGAGYMVIKLTGDVAAVKAAVSSGAATARKLGNLVAAHVIPRPDDQVIDTEICGKDNVPPFNGSDSEPEDGKTSGAASEKESKGSQENAVKASESKPATATAGKEEAPAEKAAPEAKDAKDAKDAPAKQASKPEAKTKSSKPAASEVKNASSPKAPEKPADSGKTAPAKTDGGNKPKSRK